jgi:hypothetical protein
VARKPSESERGHKPALALFVVAAMPLFGHDPVTTKLTWTQEVSRVVYKHCASCHKDFTTYEGIRPWAKAIRDEVASRRMPPWGAVKGIGDFVGDPSLSGPELDILIAWVEGGAPEGDKAYLPARIPAPDSAPVLPPSSKSVIVHKELLLTKANRVLGLRPTSVGEHTSLEAWALLPDGTVDRLIWLNDLKRNTARTFVLREPALFPAGTRLKVSAPEGAAVAFYLK